MDPDSSYLVEWLIQFSEYYDFLESEYFIRVPKVKCCDYECEFQSTDTVVYQVRYNPFEHLQADEYPWERLQDY